MPLVMLWFSALQITVLASAACIGIYWHLQERRRRTPLRLVKSDRWPDNWPVTRIKM